MSPVANHSVYAFFFTIGCAETTVSAFWANGECVVEAGTTWPAAPKAMQKTESIGNDGIGGRAARWAPKFRAVIPP
eukprot:50694-Prymnesium_polylepis.1